MASAASGSALRSEPDPTRPAVSTGVAATRFQLSRFYVAQLVQQGKLAGYGVRRREGGRVRWYVYADALPDEPARPDSAQATGLRPELLPGLLTNLLDARHLIRLARDERTGAHRRLVDVVDAMTAAVRAAQNSDATRLSELLLDMHEIRSDEERRLLTAQNYEAKAEAYVDAALQAFWSGGKDVESHGRDHAGSAPGTQLTRSGSPRPRASG